MVLVLVMGATLGNFCVPIASHGCHSWQFLLCLSWELLPVIFVMLVMGATQGNFHGASASHGYHPEQHLWC